LFAEVGLPADHWFWDFAASLLASIIVSRDRALVVPSLLCYALVNILQARHQT
jgi:hypothetical protein